MTAVSNSQPRLLFLATEYYFFAALQKEIAPEDAAKAGPANAIVATSVAVAMDRTMVFTSLVSTLPMDDSSASRTCSIQQR